MHEGPAWAKLLASFLASFQAPPRSGRDPVYRRPGRDVVDFSPDWASPLGGTDAAARQTTTIPIVMTSTNPLGLGFVASLARPGGNVTGLSLLGPEAAGKRLELLKDMIPGLAKVAALWNPNDPGAQFSLKETQAAAQTLKVKLQILEARSTDAFDGAFLAASREGSEAVVLLPTPPHERERRPDRRHRTAEAVADGVLFR